MRRFRQGLTVLERRAIREDVTVRELRKAYQQAREYRLTPVCREAMLLTMRGQYPEKVRGLHGACRGEEPGNVGCLCLCHDDDRRLAGGLASGIRTATEPLPEIPG